MHKPPKKDLAHSNFHTSHATFFTDNSPVSGIPHWAGLTVTSPNGNTLSATVSPLQINDFSSAMDFKAGVLSWNYIWGPGGDPLFAVSYTMFVSKLHVNQAAVQLSLTPLADVNVTLTDILEGDCAVRTDFVDKGTDTQNGTAPMIWSAVSPNGVGNVTAYVYSTLTGDGITTTRLVNDSALIGTNNSSIAQSASVQLKAGKTSTFTKFIGAASSDAFGSDAQSVAREASADGASTGFTSLLASHSEEWASILTADSVDNYALEDGTLPGDPFIVEQQITSVTNPYQMLQNTVGSNAIAAAGNNSELNVNSIMVGGLGSDSCESLFSLHGYFAPHDGRVLTRNHTQTAV